MNWLYGPDASGTYAIGAEPKKHAKGPGTTTAIAWVKDRKTAARIVEALTLMDALSRAAGGADVAWSNPFKADPRIDELIRQVRHLVRQGEHMTEQSDRLEATLTEVKTNLAQFRTDTDEALAEVGDDVQKLLDKIANGTPQDLTAAQALAEEIKTAVAEIQAKVKGYDPVPDDPAPPPPEPGGFRSGR